MEKDQRKTRVKKLNAKLPDDIKEKSYLTRNVDTSIAILNSPEDDIVLEALLFLSKYADICLINLNYLQQKGLLKKVLDLFDRNICVLRLSLRLLSTLLTIEDVVFEFDQGIYDNYIKRITEFYITHKDSYVKEFSVTILMKLANSCRITSLIFSVDLLNPILATLKSLKNLGLLQNTMALFDALLTAPAALSVLPELKNFDASVIVNYLKHTDKEVKMLAFKIISKLTLFALDNYQTMFKNQKLVEKMMEVVMNPELKVNHALAMQIISNCLNSDITSTYFIESVQFLEFCCWVKTCDNEYLYQSVDIFLKLSAIPSIRQILFDLSVEESILYFLRSNEKCILNKTCEAISYMSEHKYCCEHMLTTTVVGTIFNMLDRTDDEEDPQNDIAYRTLANLTKRSFKAMSILNQLGAQAKFIDLFSKGLTVMSDESFSNVTEILYHFVVHPNYQHTVVNSRLFKELLKAIQSNHENVSNLSTEMITYCLANPDFVDLFLNQNGPEIVVETLNGTNSLKLQKSLLVLIHCMLYNEAVTVEFIKAGLIKVLKDFPEHIKVRSPLIKTVLDLIFNAYLPLKFYETHRLHITDKLNNQFYLINGVWRGSFPFLDILRYEKVAPIVSIYVVDYTYEVKEPYEKLSNTSSSLFEESKLDFMVDSMILKRSLNTFFHRESAHSIHYGDLSPDPYLPKYIYHINKLFEEGKEKSLIDKIRMLSIYVDTMMCGPDESLKVPQKYHTFLLHIQSLKLKLGTNMIPIGYLRIGFHCERSLLFKAIADRICIPCSLVQGENHIYWNEVALLEDDNSKSGPVLVFYIVDLMNRVGSLIPVGSRDADQYCNEKHYNK
ncbi:uncharacterized protein LOC130900462 isoform X2 [Diorhabda carinulata]|uniref:uncharacterized protein LOC130900462 isoform X2 n=1 Tax=Diorhabda carinulata TaxID=1163345 RepID=UPI0025A16B53|nr:uncharacterized protein LOC130900462 isoform X2 [Diorhabda carinulata]